MPKYNVILDISVVASTEVEVTAKNVTEAKKVARAYVKENPNELDWRFPDDIIIGVVDRRDPMVAEVEEI